MTPDQVQLLRKLALNERDTINSVMGGEIGALVLDQRTKALVSVAVLLGVDSDTGTFRSVVEDGLAAGIDDADLVDTLIVVAPIIGVARMSASLPLLMEALDVEIIED